MNLAQYTSAAVVLFFVLLTGQSAVALQAGAGYGRQFQGNTDIEQYELVVRESLPYTRTVGDIFLVSSAIELGMAVVRDSATGNSGIGRFSLMPQIVIKPYHRVHYFMGFGCGFMGGDTALDSHDLGGAFFMASKIGVRLLLGEEWGVEYVYYHQSNGGIYEHNASLNMQHLAIFFTF